MLLPFRHVEVESWQYSDLRREIACELIEGPLARWSNLAVERALQLELVLQSKSEAQSQSEAAKEVGGVKLALLGLLLLGQVAQVRQARQAQVRQALLLLARLALLVLLWEAKVLHKWQLELGPVVERED